MSSNDLLVRNELRLRSGEAAGRPTRVDPGSRAGSVPRLLGEALAGVALLLVVAGCDDVFTDPFDFGSVEVQAERRNGDPVPGVEFTLFTGTRHLAIDSTGADGRVLFRHVPAGPMGVSAWSPPEPFLPADPDRDWFRTFRMEEGEERTFTFIYVGAGPGAVEVRTRDGVEEPLGGVRVQLYSPEAPVGDAETDPDGLHVWEDVPFGNYGVRVLPGRGYLLPGPEIFQDGILVEAGWREDAVFTLERCRGGEIRVRVTDAAGAPLADVELVLYDPQEVVGVASTASDGAHTFGDLACAVGYGVRVLPPAGHEVEEGPGSTFMDGLDIQGEEDVIEIEFTLQEAAS